MNAYDAASIEVLDGVNAVRQRPGMYIGSTDADGLYQLVNELIENAADEVLVGACSRIDVIAHADQSVSVRDNGRGIPTELHPTFGLPACEVVLTKLHSGAKFGQNGYGISSGLHGVGLSCVNALSQELTIEIDRGGYRHTQRFERGISASVLRNVGKVSGTGTLIRFLPDRDIFGAGSIEIERVRERLRVLAHLNRGLTTSFCDERTGEQETFGGSDLPSLLKHRVGGKLRSHPEPIMLAAQGPSVGYEAAIFWTTAFTERIDSYANNVRTSDGGTHERGLRVGIFEAVRRAIEGMPLASSLRSTDVLEGVNVVLATRLVSPEFEGQTKRRLRNVNAERELADLVQSALHERLVADPALREAVVSRVTAAMHARLAASTASERARFETVSSEATAEVFQQQFGIRSQTWHDSCVWLTDRQLLQAHADLCKVGRDAHALDVCCGSGIVGAQFKNKVTSVVGLDLTAEMRALAATRLDRVYEGTVYDLPFGQASFELVVTREVLHLLARPEGPIREIFRVLKPGGQFIFGNTLAFSEVDGPWMWRIFKKKQPLVVNMFHEADLRRLLHEAGFVDVEMRECLVWEGIDRWIDTHETSSLHRHEIRRLYYDAPQLVREVHPFQVDTEGRIRDCWRWGVFSARKPHA